MKPGVSALLAAAACVVALPALADDAACIQSYEATQTLRKGGKLREAHAEAMKCAAESCPSVLAKDCQKWQGEIDALLPSVIFEVKGNAGEPLSKVKITANGQPLVDRLDGSPVTLEAGELKLHFESPDGRGLPVDQTITLKEGEKSRKVMVQLGGAPPAESKPLPLGPIVFGATGVVALGVGTVFAIMGAGAESDLDRCKPRCTSDDVNGVSTKYAVADILFTAGAVSLVAAAYMFITRPATTAAVGFLKRKPGFGLEF
ncbi:MAG: hypothetical protein U0270_18245 [Labilithrix sp.]